MNASKKRGTLPDVRCVGDVSSVPRTEATQLSQARHDQLCMLCGREDARRGELVRRFREVNVSEKLKSVRKL